VARFRHIVTLTSASVLAVTDSADVSMGELDLLYTEVRAEQLPIVFLNVLRRVQAQKTGARSFYLGGRLDIAEAARFVERYATDAPSKRADLERLMDHGEHRTPFHFGLFTYQSDYVGITKYVRSRLDDLTEAQASLLVHLSLVYHYGQRPLPSQIFARLLNLPANRVVRLQSVLPEHALDLLVEEPEHVWRPLHDAVALGVLQQALGASGQDQRLWKQNLSMWARRLAELGADQLTTPSAAVEETLQRVFVFRENREALGAERANRYSQLIGDIPSLEGRASVLQYLVELFPEEAHYWGHLGRFYTYEMNNREKAEDCLEKALSLAQEDPVLHHMLGMCYRQTAYEAMRSMAGDREDAKPGIDEVMALCTKAAQSFASSREIDADNEHAYVSQIQLALRAVDFGFRLSQAATKSDFLTRPEAMWFRERLDEAEGLLAQVRAISQGERDSAFIATCLIGVDDLYGDFSTVLQGWRNLLVRKDVYRPPVRRQLAYAYLARRNRSWDELAPKEISQIAQLMEENLLEKPDDEHSLRLWFQAFKRADGSSIDSAIERIAYWWTNTGKLDAAYYLYVLYAVKVIEGGQSELVRCKDLTKDCSRLAMKRRNRTISFEWLGDGQSLQSLVHFSVLGERDESRSFWTDTSKLRLEQGRVADIRGPEAGHIELSSGLLGFFVPSRARSEKGGAMLKGRDENALVETYVGFSYDGIRAWDVRSRGLGDRPV